MWTKNTNNRLCFVYVCVCVLVIWMNLLFRRQKQSQSGVCAVRKKNLYTRNRRPADELASPRGTVVRPLLVPSWTNPCLFTQPCGLTGLYYHDFLCQWSAHKCMHIQVLSTGTQTPMKNLIHCCWKLAKLGSVCAIIDTVSIIKPQKQPDVFFLIKFRIALRHCSIKISSHVAAAFIGETSHENMSVILMLNPMRLTKFHWLYS